MTPTAAEFEELTHAATETDGYLDALHECLDAMLLERLMRYEPDWADQMTAFYRSLRALQVPLRDSGTFPLQ